MGVRHAALAVFAWCILSAAPSQANKRRDIRHTVKRGDNLALLAAEYYGDRRHAVFILVANKMTHPRPLKPGETLRIPMNRKLTTQAGDTLQTLAKSYLGDARRAEFLAEFNGIPATGAVPVGAELEVPLTVTHTAAGEESLDNIAAAYFGTRKKASLLSRYNFLEKNQLSAGESIVVPITHVRVQASKLPPRTEGEAQRSKARKAEQGRAAALMPGMRTAWRDGNYKRIKLELSQVKVEYLDAKLAVDVLVLLGSAYVAFGDSDTELAIATFERALKRSPDHELDPRLVSPKILALWRRAGGKTKKR